MDKIKLELPTVEFEEVKLSKDLRVMVNPYINMATQLSLVKLYLETYFNQEKSEKLLEMPRYNYFSAEQTLDFALIDLCTNIDLQSLDYDLFVANQYMTEVIQNIKNYYHLRDLIESSVSIVEKQLEFGKNVELIKEQFYSVLNEISSHFDAENVQKQLENVLNEVKNSPLAPLLEESKKVTKKSKPRQPKVGE
jgi:hypothetical protein